ncbi:hypothetical protein DSO57_1015712 [Entomophthora muscae]|uniref:Uncharacterized protein n=1 Tax=Entomophthora muscae TaxID=34485 RepID=A0ACC2RWB6_9FUNG|nr:hypothetical protein DSO57_1015712 [Entomophthora muscae]
MSNVYTKTVKVARSDLEKEVHVFNTEIEEDPHSTLKLLEAKFNQTFVEATGVPDQDEAEPDSSSDELENIGFRLFSSASKVIQLEVAPESLELVRGDDYFEADESIEQMHKFASVAISHENIVSDSKIPWEMHFYANKVIALPWDPTPEKKLSKNKKRRLNLQEKKRWAKEEHRVSRIIERKLDLKPLGRFHPNRFFRKVPPSGWRG